jgi:hypothetical protein
MTKAKGSPLAKNRSERWIDVDCLSLRFRFGTDVGRCEATHRNQCDDSKRALAHITRLLHCD